MNNFVVELTDYVLDGSDIKCGLRCRRFVVSKGDRCSLSADSPEYAQGFLKALATLIWPIKGCYRFKGEPLDFTDYRNLLPYKRRIGFIASGSALLSNRTVRDNLLFMRYHFENKVSLEFDKRVNRWLCMLNLQDHLHRFPAELDPIQARLVIVLREIAKFPDLLLIEHPEAYMRQTASYAFAEVMEDVMKMNIPIVFISYNSRLVEIYSTTSARIENGLLITDK